MSVGFRKPAARHRTGIAHMAVGIAIVGFRSRAKALSSWPEVAGVSARILKTASTPYVKTAKSGYSLILVSDEFLATFCRFVTCADVVDPRADEHGRKMPSGYPT